MDKKNILILVLIVALFASIFYGSYVASIKYETGYRIGKLDGSVETIEPTWQKGYENGYIQGELEGLENGYNVGILNAQAAIASNLEIPQKISCSLRSDIVSWALKKGINGTEVIGVFSLPGGSYLKTTSDGRTIYCEVENS